MAGMFHRALLIFAILVFAVGCGQMEPKISCSEASRTGGVLASGQEAEQRISVIVRGQVIPDVVKAGEPIPLTVTVANHFSSPIYHNTFSIEPSDWNGETCNISLVDIYRDDRPRNLYYARPEVNVPVRASGIGSYEIEAGKILAIRTDARKWKLHDEGRPVERFNGWFPGRYKVTLRVDNLTVDKYCKLSVLSNPIEFKIE